jgi:hypothetical protein
LDSELEEKGVHVRGNNEATTLDGKRKALSLKNFMSNSDYELQCDKIIFVTSHRQYHHFRKKYPCPGQTKNNNWGRIRTNKSCTRRIAKGLQKE